MLMYIAKTFTATAIGQRLKDVTCEKCGTHFQYMLSRSGTGTASAPYYLGQRSAERRAEANAKKHLAKLMERDEELVPCPTCRWVNESAIRQYRLSKYSTWHYGAWICMGVALAVDLVLYFSYEDIFGREARIFSGPILTIAVIGLCLGAAFLGAQKFLRGGINPNKILIDGKPSIPPGTPPALVDGKSVGEPAATLTPIPSALPEDQSDPEWVVYRANQKTLVPLCCECLGPPETTFNLPFTTGRVEPVPICNACRKKLAKRWYVHMAFLVPAAFILGGLGSLFGTDLDEFGKIMTAVIIGGVLAIFAVAWTESRLKPYSFIQIDGERDVWKARFRNPAYTALIKRKIGESDGVYEKNS